MKLQLPSDQRFTCQQCGLCCRGAWVVVTPAEVERYRAVGAARWYRDDGAPAADPFEPVAHGHYRIRKRADGACGFLSPDNRCRIHEELGAAAKPLACRVFPFRFHAVEGRPLVTASATCPTIVRNEGEAVDAQARAIGALRAEWARAFPEPSRGIDFVRGRRLDPDTLSAIKAALRQMLDGCGEGPLEPAQAVARIARWLEDLTRHRVLRLKPAAFAEYVRLTGAHAAAGAAPAPRGAPSAVTRLLARGFLFTVVAVRDQAASAPGGLSRHLRRLRVLAHLHGLGPATEAVDRAALRTTAVDTSDPEAGRILRHALHAIVDGLGTGQRPLVDEVGVRAATLSAGIALAATAARRAGRDRIDAARLAAGIADAAALGHADTGALAALLPTLAGGIDALRLLEARLAGG